jgi:hypothetical protein
VCLPGLLKPRTAYLFGLEVSIPATRAVRALDLRRAAAAAAVVVDGAASKLSAFKGLVSMPEFHQEKDAAVRAGSCSKAAKNSRLAEKNCTTRGRVCYKPMQRSWPS